MLFGRAKLLASVSLAFRKAIEILQLTNGKLRACYAATCQQTFQGERGT